MPRVMISPDQIKRGDQMVGEDGRMQWTALDDADPIGEKIYCSVQFADGGRDMRSWRAAVPAKFEVLRA